MASYMAKDYKTTMNAVESMFRFEYEKKTLKPNEKNGLRLLEVHCYMKMGDNESALKKLQANKKEILD